MNLHHISQRVILGKTERDFRKDVEGYLRQNAAQGRSNYYSFTV